MTGQEQHNQAVNRERTLLEGLLYYLSYLLRHKYLIIGMTLTAALGSIGFSLLSLQLPPERSPLPNYYRAYAVLIINQESSSADMATMLSALGFRNPVMTADVNYGELGSRVLRSRQFIDRIVEENGIIERHGIVEKEKTVSRKIVLGNSDVAYDSRTGTLTIGYEDTDPEFSRDVVESMVANLQEWFMQWEGSSSQQELEAMRRKLDEVSRELNSLEQEIKEFQTRYGVFSVEQLAEAQTAILTDLQSQLIQKEVEIKNYAGFATIEDQSLIRMQAERESLWEVIRQIEEGIGSNTRQMPPRAELPALALEYSHLKLSHELQMRIFQNLKEQYEVKKLTSSAGPVFSVLEPAEIPEEKSRPSRSRLCMIVTVIGFMSSIALALFIDLGRSINNDPEKKRILQGNRD
jgi:capsule polysaccharide export protein KpsE/RkpR